MSGKRRNEIHKKNRRKGEMAFFNTKASFVSGIVLIIAMLHDTINVIVPIPKIIIIIEVLVCVLLCCLVLATNKLDHKLYTDSIEKFGGYLTMYSIFIFMFGKIVFPEIENVTFKISITNTKLVIFLIYSLFELVGIVGAICLLSNKFPKKR